MAEKRKDDRTRNWTMVVYPESAPENWREILDNLHVPYLVSPLHDKDVNPDGEVKKAHWHVVLIFENKKSYDQIKEIADKLNAPIPQKVESLRGMVRYLVHTDNPEKHQYERADIEIHGGDDIDKYFETASSDRAILMAIVKHVKENNVTSFAKLAYYAIEHDKKDWLDCMANRNTMFLNAIVTAQYHDNEKGKVEPATRRTNLQEQEKEDYAEFNKLNIKEKARFLKEKGFTYQSIADTLGISLRSAKLYVTGK